MVERISIAVLDPDSTSHDYSLIKWDENVVSGETTFDITIASNVEELLGILGSTRGAFDSVLVVGYIEDIRLDYASRELKDKLSYFKEFDPEAMSYAVIRNMKARCLTERQFGDILFSIFTPVFNTPKEVIDRLYNSLLGQIYTNWNWYILDDSDTDEVASYIDSKHDYRIKIIRNYSRHGVIGMNKRTVAMIADGEWLVEVDHDDALVPEALAEIYKAIMQFPDSDFVYSDSLEIANGIPITYGNGFALGQGEYRAETIMGNNCIVPVGTPSINAKSVRAIYAMPNHVRCWKRDFYHKIGGHNPDLGVLDDMDIIIRTFLNGKMTHVNKVLYIQFEDGRSGESDGMRGDTAQGRRYKEIQRTNSILYNIYDSRIHDRILELGYEDPVWEDSVGRSFPSRNVETLPDMGNQYYSEPKYRKSAK